MFLDTVAATKIAENLYRYGHVGTWNGLFFNSEELCQHHFKCSCKEWTQKIYKKLLTIKDNEVTEEILRTIPSNGITIVNEDGTSYLLKNHKPVRENDAEKYIQEQMKKINFNI